MSEPKTELNQDFCLWDSAEREFRIGVVGSGPGFLSILDIIRNEQYQEFLPGLKLTALAEPGPGESMIAFAKGLGVPVYGSWREMLEVHQNLDLIVELSGSASKLKAMRDVLPPSVSLVDHFAAVFLCGLHNMLQVSAHCRVDLDRHKALLQAIIDEIREDIILLDRDGRVKDMNRNVLKRAGGDKEALIGLPCFDVQTMEDGGRFCRDQDCKCPFFITLETGSKAEALFTRVDSQGRLRYYRIYSYPVYDPFGHMSHVLIMRRDITRRTSEEKLRQQAEKMAVIGEMSMYLAHEIRNPLFAIGGFTKSLLGASGLGEKERQKLQIIDAETKRLNDMLNSILALSRKIEVELRPTEVNALTGEVVDLMRISQADKGVRFVFDPDPNLPMVAAEAERLKQCLASVLQNAVDAMDGAPGGEVRVRTGMEEDLVVIEVKDAGRGFTSEQLEHVFDPFRSGTGGGYGLGMAMIKKILEEFGGRVSLTSLEGRGATVSLLLAPILAGGESAGLAARPDRRVS